MTLHALGCNAFEVRRAGTIVGSGFFQKVRRRSSAEVWAWVDRPGHPTEYLNPGQFKDFVRMVEKTFGAP